MSTSPFGRISSRPTSGLNLVSGIYRLLRGYNTLRAWSTGRVVQRYGRRYIYRRAGSLSRLLFPPRRRKGGW